VNENVPLDISNTMQLQIKPEQTHEPLHFDHFVLDTCHNDSACGSKCSATHGQAKEAQDDFCTGLFS
jgi:hypothetical protein